MGRIDPKSSERRSPFSVALGEELKVARGDWLQRADVAAALPGELNYTTVASYERGERDVSTRRLVELSVVLKVSAPYLLARAMKRAGMPVRSWEVHEEELKAYPPARAAADLRHSIADLQSIVDQLCPPMPATTRRGQVASP